MSFQFCHLLARWPCHHFVILGLLICEMGLGMLSCAPFTVSLRSRRKPADEGHSAVWMQVTVLAINLALFPMCPQLTQGDMLHVEPSLLQYPDWRGHLL